MYDDEPIFENIQPAQIDDLQQSFNVNQITFGPHLQLSRGDELYGMEEEYSMVQERKFVCNLDLLLDAFQSRSHTPGCTELPNIKCPFVGVTLILNCQCSAGHKYRFCSSHQVNDVYANNLQAAAAIILLEAIMQK